MYLCVWYMERTLDHRSVHVHSTINLFRIYLISYIFRGLPYSQRRAEGTDDEGNAYDYTYVTRQRPALPPRQEGLYAPVSREARWEVPKRSVSLLKELGSGHFGKVMKGQLKTRQGSKIVAIKMLKSESGRILSRSC